MELTGKCKEDFFKWLSKQSYYYERIYEYYTGGTWKPEEIDISDIWHNLPFVMQYGVYVDFFDSVNIFITNCYIDNLFIQGNYYYELASETGMSIVESKTTTREESRIEAIKKANEIYNEKFK